MKKAILGITIFKPMRTKNIQYEYTVHEDQITWKQLFVIFRSPTSRHNFDVKSCAIEFLNYLPLEGQKGSPLNIYMPQSICMGKIELFEDFGVIAHQI